MSIRKCKIPEAVGKEMKGIKNMRERYSHLFQFRARNSTLIQPTKPKIRLFPFHNAISAFRFVFPLLANTSYTRVSHCFCISAFNFLGPASHHSQLLIFPLPLSSRLCLTAPKSLCPFLRLQVNHICLSMYKGFCFWYNSNHAYGIMLQLLFFGCVWR